MLKTFRVTGYATNRRGLLIEFKSDILADNTKQAKEKALYAFKTLRCKHTRIAKIVEVINHE